jgi:hypothetical protein
MLVGRSPPSPCPALAYLACAGFWSFLLLPLRLLLDADLYLLYFRK